MGTRNCLIIQLKGNFVTYPAAISCLGYISLHFLPCARIAHQELCAFLMHCYLCSNLVLIDYTSYFTNWEMVQEPMFTPSSDANLFLIKQSDDISSITMFLLQDCNPMAIKWREKGKLHQIKGASFRKSPWCNLIQALIREPGGCCNIGCPLKLKLKSQEIMFSCNLLFLSCDSFWNCAQSIAV